ncbi:phage terminase large subunit [Luteimonas sp. 50]|uniref:Phage terminase large subunit n=1 Tax=Cognatiluteimonas sedimenti TaxID=2927791 RepID=A0ABT0A1Y8_9GAMM|nr:phage terminase large subunit [Lysobacter sedimenti]MCJ0824976.1 phage terminase large subunit [Lysobacter sedimenti]
MSDGIELNAFQERALLVPESIDLALTGGRGGGKSYLMALLALRHIEQYGKRARVLYIRRTYKGLEDFVLTTQDLFAKVYGPAARYNGAEHVWKLPSGGILELGQLESQADYAKYQGRSFTLLMADECGQYQDASLLDMLRSNLRGPKDLPIRTVYAANPGGVGHMWIARRFVFTKAAPWTPFTDEKSKRLCVNAPSTFAANQFLDVEMYREQLGAACADDPELLRAWVDGDWSVARGAYFADCLDEDRVATNLWPEIPRGWWTWLAHDFGSAAPSVTYVLAESPGGEGPDSKFYPRGSIVAVDELATNRSDDRLNEGIGWTVPVLSDAIKEMCERWKIDPEGVADDACFARSGHSVGSIADEFQRAGVHFVPAQKGDRVQGWQRMRRMLADAGKLDRPGLYVSRTCRYFWLTAPYAGRDLKRPEDVDSSGADHALDAMRYGTQRVAWATVADVRIERPT